MNYRKINKLLRADCVWKDENGKIVWDDERAIDILREAFLEWDIRKAERETVLLADNRELVALNDAYQSQNTQLRRKAKALREACEFVDRWWRLPNAERTTANIEPAMRLILAALAQGEGEGK
jgi:hypothetical protein